MSEAANLSSEPSHGTKTLRELRQGFRSGKTKSYEWRMAQLEALDTMLSEHLDQITDAIVADLGKPRFEAFTTEINFLQSEIAHTKKHLKKWMKPERVKSSAVVQPAVSKVYREPYGVALVIGAWNYPLGLSVGPAIGAIAAGNCVVIKPSEVAENTSALLAGLLPQYLDPECVRVVEGGVPETTDLLEQKFDYIFYTGNSQVGRIIMSAAAKHLTPLTLELGGKSPAIIDADADIKVSVKRIVWGKYTNAGQTCVAPDYLLVNEAIYDDVVAALQETITEFYGDDPKQSEDYGRIINKRHHKRLVSLIESGTVAHGGAHDEDERYIEPTVLTDVDASSKVMSDEIFGPILPVLKVRSIEESIDFINDRPKPLALYCFTKNKQTAKHVIQNTSSGGGSINHVWLHLAVPDLPFGGVGESGMGNYHGQSSFELFSHKKSILSKPTLIDPSVIYPPYTNFKKSVIKKLA